MRGQGPIIDEEGFQLVQGRCGNRIIGNNSTSANGLQGAPPPKREIWVSRIFTGDENKVKHLFRINNIHIHKN